MNLGILIIFGVLLIATLFVEFKHAKAQQRAKAEAFRLKKLAEREVEKVDGEFKQELTAINIDVVDSAAKIKGATAATLAEVQKIEAEAKGFAHRI